MGLEALGLLLLFPLVWPWIMKYKFHKTICWKEMFLQIAIVCGITSIIFIIGVSGKTYDQEIWNGKITKKSQVKVSCWHSYDCMCTTDSEGYTSCQTCYEHSHDWAWRVWTNIEDVFHISRVDRRGKKEPPRFTKVKINQPYAAKHHYTNYIKAIPDSLFNELDSTSVIEQFKDKIPNYPLGVYDYHYINRVLPVGVSVKNINKWNYDLSVMLNDLGFLKEVNVVLIMVNEADPNYRYAVENAWLGGKKNDVVVFIGTTNYPEIAWVDVMTWAKNKGNELFHVKLTDALRDLETIEKDKVLSTIQAHIKNYYDRPHMSDFEYLARSIVPPMWVIILAIIVSIAGSLGLSYYYHRNRTFY